MTELRNAFPALATCALGIALLATVGCGSASSSDVARGGDASPDGAVADSGPPPSLDASGAIPAQMNDVSILFPLPQSAADVDRLLAPSAAGDEGALLPSALYASIGPITGTTQTDDGGVLQEFAAYSALRVVAMRIDPCFASLAPDPHGIGCTAQLRLVFQEVTWQTGSGAFAFDSALHAFYELSRGEFLALAQALVGLRAANAGNDAPGPLAPHPIIARQGLGGAMSKGVEALILQYAGEKNLARLAQLSTINNELEEIWNMSAFDVADGGATPSPIATLADGGAFVEGLGGGVRPSPDGGASILFVTFGPTTTPSNDFSALDDGTPQSLATSDVQAAFDALVRVENPKDNSPNTVDCASCHVATPTEKLNLLPLFSLDDTTSPLAFQPDGKSVTQAEMAATFISAESQFNIHAFSYFGQSAGISQRTVNETAAIVEYLNALSP